MRTISASRARSELMSLIDDVAATGEPVVITKRGEPLVKLVRETRGERYPLGGVILCSPEELVDFRGEWPESDHPV